MSDPNTALRELDAWIAERLGQTPPVQRAAEQQWLAARLQVLGQELAPKPEPDDATERGAA